MTDTADVVLAHPYADHGPGETVSFPIDEARKLVEGAIATYAPDEPDEETGASEAVNPDAEAPDGGVKAPDAEAKAVEDQAPEATKAAKADPGGKATATAHAKR